MPDTRFFEDLGPLSLEAIVDLTGARLADGAPASRLFKGVASLADAGPDDVSFIAGKAFVPALKETRAGAVFATEAFAQHAPTGAVVLTSPAPHGAWSRLAAALFKPRLHRREDGDIHPTAALEESVVLGPGAIVGPGASIGAGSVVGAYAVVGPGVAIGRGCEIGPHVTLAHALLGDRVKVYAGAHIGEAGFGVAGDLKGAIDIPQLGRVILQDNVTVGAGACIDRGALTDTVIGENSKLDNLVHVAHNVRMGRNCVAAAFTGIAGSTIIGDGVRFGGRAGVADHLVLGDGSAVAAAGGVMRDIPPGETWGGVPAVPVREWIRQSAWLARAAKGRRDNEGGEP